MPGPDASLPELVLRRLAISEQVAAAKFEAGRPVDDPVREQRELARVRTLAREIGLDPDLAARFLSDQILASKQVQRRLFAHWTAHPGDLPEGGPDLSVLRAELDGLTVALLDRLTVSGSAAMGPPESPDELKEPLRTAFRSLTQRGTC
ncbi:gamma subclass chorismate mutase AroQ [Amycolatopsis rubida]|uniref:chorismate mutase n=1 Tax=Amycolatopsis rubida TaxID=112413 RepID=A0ABX0BVR6_9PSEU|nr:MULTISPECIES: gamma subclass chorismate mutase AroQ [Amycolatopsis]MYW94720.1 gamma subclass chorismate mutase AroQ [Amycolatopsis rubida]NEC59707.1 gamma subclass chorismate mutase AroQ [Amycolatopsis rubida]OAP24540.1 Secreted chorismate mutase precursor [Amycolatopsis sp. M39]